MLLSVWGSRYKRSHFSHTNLTDPLPPLQYWPPLPALFSSRLYCCAMLLMLATAEAQVHSVSTSVESVVSSFSDPSPRSLQECESSRILPALRTAGNPPFGNVLVCSPRLGYSVFGTLSDNTAGRSVALFVSFDFGCVFFNVSDPTYYEATSGPSTMETTTVTGVCISTTCCVIAYCLDPLGCPAGLSLRVAYTLPSQETACSMNRVFNSIGGGQALVLGSQCQNTASRTLSFTFNQEGGSHLLSVFTASDVKSCSLFHNFENGVPAGFTPTTSLIRSTQSSYSIEAPCSQPPCCVAVWCHASNFICINTYSFSFVAPSTPSSSVNLGAIVGIVLGVVFWIIVIAGIVYFLRSRQLCCFQPKPSYTSSQGVINPTHTMVQEYK